MQDLNGQRLGNYELRERLGRGGMAEVYKAYQPGMDRFVAIKVMLGHLATDSDFVERFRREAQAVGKLRHPHIVNVFDFGTTNDVYYMAMEFIQGETLKSYILRKQRLEPQEALRIAGQIADALDYAHSSGMIHRDLKPANIMFIDQSNRHTVLTDFGIARILGQAGLTVSGAMVGTPAYISPEAARGEPTDARADLYGLGVILYEMLTGTVPYDADTPLAIVLKHMNAPLPTRQDYGDSIPEPIERVILKSMTKEPDDRYQTAAEMKVAIERALVELQSTEPTKVSAPTQAERHEVPHKAAPEPAAVTEVHTAGRNSMLLYGGAAAAVVVVIIIALLVFGGGDGAGDDVQGTRVAAVGTDPTSEATDEALIAPTSEPEAATEVPTEMPTDIPTDEPEAATEAPTEVPTDIPTDEPEPTLVAQLAPESGVSLRSRLSPLMTRAEEMYLAGVGDTIDEFLAAEVAADPENVDALVTQSLWLSFNYESDAAIESANQAITLAPESAMPYLALSDALLLWPNRDEERSTAEVRRALELEPNNAEAYWRLARNLEMLGEYDAAWAAFEEAERRGASGFGFVQFAGEYLFYHPDYERAVPYLRAQVGTTLDDRSTRRLYLMGALIQTGQEAEAFELAQDTAAGVTDPALLTNLAYIAYRSGEFSQARTWLQTAQALSTEVPQAKYVLALVEGFGEGNTPEAVQLLESLDGVDFDRWPFLVREFGHEPGLDLARILVRGSDYDRALEVYARLIEDDSWRPDLYMERAGIYLETDQRDLALQDLREAYRIIDHEAFPETSLEIQRQLYSVFWNEELPVLFPAVQSPITEAELTIPVLAGLSELQDAVDRLLLENNEDAAFALVNDALEENPENTDALAARTRIYLYLGDGEKALADAERAVEIAPASRDGHFALIDTLLHWSVNRPADAVRAAQQAVENTTNPDDPGLVWRLGAVHRANGQQQAAAQNYAHAAEVGAKGVDYAAYAGAFWLDVDELARALEPLKTVFVGSRDSYLRTYYVAALILLGDFDEALRAGLQLAPDAYDVPYHYDLVAYAAYRTDAPELARAWARFKIALMPDEASDAHYIDAMITWHVDGEPEAALAALEPLIQERPTSDALVFSRELGTNAWMDAAAILVELEQLDDAMSHLNAFMEHVDDYAPAYEARADIWLLLEDVEAARNDLRTALENTQNPDERQRLVDRIVALGPAQ